jgi:hypothetical protein
MTVDKPSKRLRPKRPTAIETPARGAYAADATSSRRCSSHRNKTGTAISSAVPGASCSSNLGSGSNRSAPR